ncbi:BLUF domain-containing protein [Pseudoroseomonas wenyumeiae]
MYLNHGGQTTLTRILDSSRRNNERDGLTGALLFNDDCFAQVLEGDSAMLHQVFERIQCDLRHRDTVVLEFGPAEREFGQWSMAYAGRIGAEARYAILGGVDKGPSHRDPEVIQGCLLGGGAGAARFADGRGMGLLRALRDRDRPLPRPPAWQSPPGSGCHLLGGAHGHSLA